MKALSWVGFSVLLVAGVATASPKWQQLQSPPAAKQIWGSGPTDLYAVGVSALYHSSDRGASWEAVAGVSGVHGVWGTGPNDVWAISDRSVSHSTDGGGAVWVPKRLDSLDFAAVMEGMWGSSASDLYVFGGDRASDEVFHAAILHSRDGGATWARETVPGDTTSITAMWGSTTSDVYAVGKQGAILHSTGTGTWQVQRTASAGLAGVWGSSATDVYAVGAHGLILNSADHGKTWRERTSGVSYTLSSVYGVGAREIFVGSTEGPPLRSTDGRTFRRMTGLVARGQVWAADAEHVFVCEKTGIAYYGEAVNDTQVAGTVKPTLEREQLTSESTPAMPRAQLLPAPGL